MLRSGICILQLLVFKTEVIITTAMLCCKMQSHFQWIYGVPLQHNVYELVINLFVYTFRYRRAGCSHNSSGNSDNNSGDSSWGSLLEVHKEKEGMTCAFAYL